MAEFVYAVGSKICLHYIIYNLIKGIIDLPDLLAKLLFAVPSFNSRYLVTFTNKFHSIIYDYTYLLECECRTLNNLSKADIFHDSLP